MRRRKGGPNARGSSGARGRSSTPRPRFGTGKAATAVVTIATAADDERRSGAVTGASGAVRNSLQAQHGAHPAICAPDPPERLASQHAFRSGWSQDTANAAGANAPTSVQMAERAESSRRIGEESCALTSCRATRMRTPCRRLHRTTVAEFVGLEAPENGWGQTHAAETLAVGALASTIFARRSDR